MILRVAELHKGDDMPRCVRYTLGHW